MPSVTIGPATQEEMRDGLPEIRTQPLQAKALARALLAMALS